MELVLQTVVNAWVATFLFAVVAMGVTLVFGVMRTANFAHGEFVMLGAYTVWLLYSRGGWPFFAAALAATGVVTGIGLIAERGIFRPLRGNMVSGFIASVGLIFILQVAVGRIWGLGAAKPVPSAFPWSVEFLGVTVSGERFIIIPAGITMLGLLWFFLHRSKLGRALRATAQDSGVAALQGISINRMAALAMGIAAAFAGVAGALRASIDQVTPYLGGTIILMAFVIVIVGGVGSIGGALIASVMFGFIHTIVTTLTNSTIANIIAVVVMSVVLAIRPKGLLSHEEI